MERIKIGSKFVKKRIDKSLQEILKGKGIKIPSRSFVKYILKENVLVNEKKVKRSYKFKANDILEVDKEGIEEVLEEMDSSGNIISQEYKLDILYENSNYIILKKEKGMVVHPGVGNKKGTVANYIRGYLEGKGEYDPLMDRAGIVHRLDKGVSGLMLIAKTKEAQEYFGKQFRDRQVEKIYFAQTEKFKDSELDKLDIAKDISLEKGVEIDNRWLTVKGYIGRNPRYMMQMKFKLYEFAGSRYAVSHFLKVGIDSFLIKIDTGRMHQIRTTFEYLGRHILGDTLYSSSDRNTASDSISLESVFLSFKDMKGKQRSFSIYKQ